VSGERGLGLTACLGERDRAGGAFLAERVIDELRAAGLEAAVLMRGVEGFGAKHLRRTDRLLSLSEDLPIVVSGVGETDAVERAAATVAEIVGEPPVTVRGAVILAATDRLEPDRNWPGGPWLKATINVGRGRRIGGLPAYEAVVTRLRAAGAEGATVLLGVDGILGGERRRAGFLSRNLDVPAQVISVGSAETIARGLSSVRALPGERLVTVQEAHVCKNGGGRLEPDRAIPGRDELIRLTLYSSEQAHVGGRPVHIEAVRALRASGAVGATSMRGIWGFDGSNPPHGDRLRNVRRRVPTVTFVVDDPERSRRWLEIFDELTPSRGLITSERVRPAGRRR
jgi:PII-like signaling protein